MKRQMKRCAQPALSDIRIEWKTFQQGTIRQAPTQILSLFSGERQIVYGYVYVCSVCFICEGGC